MLRCARVVLFRTLSSTRSLMTILGWVVIPSAQTELTNYPPFRTNKGVEISKVDIIHSAALHFQLFKIKNEPGWYVPRTVPRTDFNGKTRCSFQTGFVLFFLYDTGFCSQSQSCWELPEFPHIHKEYLFSEKLNAYVPIDSNPPESKLRFDASPLVDLRKKTLIPRVIAQRHFTWNRPHANSAATYIPVLHSAPNMTSFV